MVRSWDQLAAGLRTALDAAVPFPPELVPARFPFDAPLMGALALGTAAARDLLGRPRRTQLKKGQLKKGLSG
jgi:glucokinase